MSAIQPIGITMGDPAGVGPEVCLKAVASKRLNLPMVLFADQSVLEDAARDLQLSVPEHFDNLDAAIDFSKQQQSVSTFDFAQFNHSSLAIGQISAAAGKACYAYIESAIQAAISGKISGVATGPIHKEALALAGIKHPGHTEIFIEHTRSKKACMMLTSDEISCSFVTTHVGYRDVPQLLTTNRILEVIELTHDAMQKIKPRFFSNDPSPNPPQLMICALNPHAGEGGLFGDHEEERIIIPAVEQAREKGIQIEGPVPPDTAFLPERRERIDCFVCMYHDQGHIPLKALAFDKGVNTTLGLPIVRTSVDHGTAFDIARQGQASETSLIEAILLAEKLAAQK